MKSPGFWWRERSVAASLLSPLAPLYAAATARRIARPPSFTADVPVICVGNLTAGGAGKTPAVIALLERLSSLGATAFVVSRGYGGAAKGPVRVDPRRMLARDVGDEPLLLAAFAPVIVSRDRGAGARMAVAEGAQAIILDDGFQNPAVAKDLSIVLVDAAAGFGNGRVIPAGPLREPVGAGLARADFVVVVGEDDQRSRFRLPNRAPPRLDARIEPLPTGMDWTGLRALAFAGIGRPEKFFATLRSLGADVVRTVALGDHQPFNPALTARLAREARTLNARLVTTEKDAVRLPPDFRPEVLTLPVRLRLLDPAPLDEAISALVGR